MIFKKLDKENLSKVLQFITQIFPEVITNPLKLRSLIEKDTFDLSYF